MCACRVSGPATPRLRFSLSLVPDHAPRTSLHAHTYTYTEPPEHCAFPLHTPHGQGGQSRVPGVPTRGLHDQPRPSGAHGLPHPGAQPLAACLDPARRQRTSFSWQRTVIAVGDSASSLAPPSPSPAMAPRWRAARTHGAGSGAGAPGTALACTSTAGSPVPPSGPAGSACTATAGAAAVGGAAALPPSAPAVAIAPSAAAGAGAALLLAASSIAPILLEFMLPSEACCSKPLPSIAPIPDLPRAAPSPSARSEASLSSWLMRGILSAMAALKASMPERATALFLITVSRSLAIERVSLSRCSSSVCSHCLRRLEKCSSMSSERSDCTLYAWFENCSSCLGSMCTRLSALPTTLPTRPFELRVSFFSSCVPYCVAAL
mmetsp:Transcript_49109/g.136179  ORF Transcript_49109/g.136179 Transcript_49109/m.136179 type:complete len:377 (-) Transcript_49109:1099-2229(-)